MVEVRADARAEGIVIRAVAAFLGALIVLSIIPIPSAGSGHAPPHEIALDTFVPVAITSQPITWLAQPRRPVGHPFQLARPAPRRILSVPTVADTQAWALARLGPTQYACLANIVLHEDQLWNPYDTNSRSGAYGIPQALPGSKMATAGSDWRWNRITQVRWMIGYVDGRYGSACAAWAFWRTQRPYGWY